MPVVDSAEVEAFLNNHIRPFRKWFETQATHYRRRVTFFSWATIIFGLLATIFAAFPTSAVTTETYAPELIRWLVVVFSSVSTVCSGTLYSTYYQGAQRREAGRAQIFRVEHLAARHLYFWPMTNDERRTYEEGTIEQVMEVDREYGGPIGFSGGGSAHPPPNPQPPPSPHGGSN